MSVKCTMQEFTQNHHFIMVDIYNYFLLNFYICIMLKLNMQKKHLIKSFFFNIKFKKNKIFKRRNTLIHAHNFVSNLEEIKYYYFYKILFNNFICRANIILIRK